MANNASKRAINVFSGGMNLDLDKSLLKNDQYRYAENIRGVSNNEAATGSATNIEGSTEIKTPGNLDTFFQGEEIIATTTIRDYAVVFTYITGTSNPRLNKIYRIIFNSDGTVSSVTNVLNANGIDLNIPEGAVLSLVSRYEDSDTMKVYWADGNNLIKLINVAPSADASNQAITSYEQLDIVPSADLKAPSIIRITNGGNLKAGVIRYFFQAVSSAGSSSPLSPISAPVHLTIDNSDTIGSKSIDYLGTGLNATTSKGIDVGKSIQLRIDVSNILGYDKVRIISVYYYNYNEAPEITVISSSKISSAINGYVSYVDGGQGAVEEITTEQLNAISENLFIPNYIESKDNILFAANIKEIGKDDAFEYYDVRAYQFNSSHKVKITSVGESWAGAQEYTLSELADIPKDHDCIHKEIYEVDRYSDLECIYNSNNKYGGEGPNVSYSFINTYFIESYGNYWNADVYTDGISLVSPTDKYIDIRTPRIGDKSRALTSLKYRTSDGVNGMMNLSQFGVPDHTGPLNYANPYLSNKFTSYQRDEIYRFAAVFYDKKGRKSSANWIADIRFPAGYVKNASWSANIFESPDENTTVQGPVELDSAELLVKPLGISFNFNNVPESITKIEIVRSKRDINNKTVYGQGVIQKVGTYNNPANDHSSTFDLNTPHGLTNGASDDAEGSSFQHFDGVLLPHPIIAMGYHYSQLGPHFERNYYDYVPELSPENENRALDKLVMSFGFPSDYYTGVIGGDDGANFGLARAARNPGVVDHATADMFGCRFHNWPFNYDLRTSATSVDYKLRFDFSKHKLAPIFSNKDYFLYVNPETTYYGVDYVELLIPNISSPKLDLVDIIHPTSAPLSYPTSTEAASYIGAAEQNRYHVHNGGTIIPTAISFGGDINEKNRNHSDYLSTFGVVGMHVSHCASGIGTGVGLNEAGDLIIEDEYSKTHEWLDVYMSSANDMSYNGTKNVFIALGGFAAWGCQYNDSINERSAYEYRSGVDSGNIFPSTGISGISTPKQNPISSEAPMSSQTSIDSSLVGGVFKYFCSMNDYDSNSDGRQFTFIYQTGRNVSEVTSCTLRSSDIRNSSSLISGLKLTFELESFRYSKDIKPGVKFRDASTDLVGIGDRSYLNWSKPLTFGDYANGNDQVAAGEGKKNSVVALAATKTQGIHGDGLIVNTKAGNTIPSIHSYDANRKKYDWNLSHYGQFNDTKYKYLENNGAAALSTYVLNLKEMSSTIYGGSSYEDRQFSEYISTGTVVNVDNASASAITFEGDTFIGLFDYSIVRGNDNKETGKDEVFSGNILNGKGGIIGPACIRRQQKYVGALLPLESSINLHLVNSKSYIANGYNPCIQKELGSYPIMSELAGPTYTQTLNQYEYNSAYSAQNDAMGYTQQLIEENKNRTFDCRVTYSEVKTNGELLDSWSIFKPANYTDVETEYGQITQLKKFDNRLFFWQRDAFGVLSVHDRSIIQDNNISSLTLGTGDVLKTPARYITTSNGFSFGVVGGIVMSLEAMYWYDHLRAEMCSFSNSLSMFSKSKGVQTILNRSKYDITNIVPMVYDRKYNEIILTLNGLHDAININ